MTKFFGLILTLFLALSSLNAEAARRMGGGKSVGQQSNNVSQREAVKPAAPAAPSQAAAPAKPAAPEVTYAQVAERIAKADNSEKLDEAADLIGEVANEQHRMELLGKFDARRADMMGEAA